MIRSRVTWSTHRQTLRSRFIDRPVRSVRGITGSRRRAAKPLQPGAFRSCSNSVAVALNAVIPALRPLRPVTTRVARGLCELSPIPPPEPVSGRALAAHVSVEAVWDILGVRANVVGAVVSHPRPAARSVYAAWPAGRLGHARTMRLSATRI